ncbi:MAG: hypothetical protein QOI82_918 [Actinomycetota bacterium]|jgi:hypothetical protein|nr:hypothetical protein [Actinomycetota bacterium]
MDDYDELGFGGLDYLLPGIDVTLWLRIAVGLVLVLAIALFMLL